MSRCCSAERRKVTVITRENRSEGMWTGSEEEQPEGKAKEKRWGVSKVKVGVSPQCWSTVGVGGGVAKRGVWGRKCQAFPSVQGLWHGGFCFSY